MSDWHTARGWTPRVIQAARRSWAPHVAQEPVCEMCGERILKGQLWHVDHAVPLSEGGAVGRENQRPVHAACNMRAAARMTHAMFARRRRWV